MELMVIAAGTAGVGKKNDRLESPPAPNPIKPGLAAGSRPILFSDFAYAD
jgi:hypothetical protein